MVHITLDKVHLHFPTSEKAAKDMDGDEDEGPAVAGNLIKSAGNRLAVAALQNVSLTLTEGDRLGIIGSNGSGKTTLLRVMAGIYSPTAGRVESEGRTATMFSIGLGMQADASGLRNIYLSGIVSGASRKQIHTVLPDIIEFTELGEYLHLPLRTYSQGMAMRLKFACATAFQPDILLLDEWIGAGDADFQKKAQARLSSLLDESGIVVLASHNMKLMRDTAEKVLWLEKGQVRMFGPADEVMEAFAASRRQESRAARQNAA